jgi:hypothetical protein
MKGILGIVLGHLILGPLGIYIMYQDFTHPERWGTWYRNPYYAIPYWILMESIILGILICSWQQERHGEKARRLMKRAHQLLAEGRIEEADAAYAEGRWILDHKCKFKK